MIAMRGGAGQKKSATSPFRPVKRGCGSATGEGAYPLSECVVHTGRIGTEAARQALRGRGEVEADGWWGRSRRGWMET